MKPQHYSGIVQIDGKYVPVKYVKKTYPGLVPRSKKRRGKTKTGLVCLPFVDYLTHDIPIYIIASSENMFEIEEGFKLLKEIDYPLKVLVCDESMGNIIKVAKKYYPDVIIQLCLRHYSQNINKEFKVNGVKIKLKSLEKKLKYMDDNILISTHKKTVEKATKITNEIANIEFEYGYLIKIQRIFNKIFFKVKSMEELTEAENMLNEFIGKIDLNTYPHAERIKKRYKDYYEKWEYLTAFIRYPQLNIPNTTNLIEGINSTVFEIRFSSIRGFETEKTAKNYTNALILKRRFQRFKDCKKKFKHLNGKCPLEIAKPLSTFGFNFHRDDWVDFCRKLK
jgi:hypothetical protein